MSSRNPAQGSKGSLDNINLFSIITILSFFLLTPVALLRDGGFKFSTGAMQSMGILDPSLVMKRAILAGFCFHAYQQVGNLDNMSECSGGMPSVHNRDDLRPG